MQKILSYPISFIFGSLFFIALCIFHPIQWICLRFFGYHAHKQSVAILNWFLMRCTNILGTTYRIKGHENLPTDQPIILVCNHQSMYDIPPVFWHMRKYHPKYISKKELGKGIPSVSFNLRHGGSVLIDRKDAKQATMAIAKFGEYIEETKRMAVIFPEGTRSRTGKPKPFQSKGLKVLFKKIPSAIVVPMTINNSWKMQRYGSFPLGLGNRLQFQIHQPIRLADHPDHDVLISQIEQTIVQDVKL
ncbi:MAG: 1-acyl-sn-glycerol-3-phosphate acyltransferase [Flavobacteriaceae bacterium]|nr:1-acyl-sn-glycerol-3-phosphate acyltransferase [Flavobacteriaceae bacterium]